MLNDVRRLLVCVGLYCLYNLPTFFVVYQSFCKVLRLVYNISSPFRHNRKPLIFQWALTLRNAGIEPDPIPAFRSVNAHRKINGFRL